MTTKVVEALKDSQGRVMSMSMIHEKLYRSGNLSDIDVGVTSRDL